MFPFQRMWFNPDNVELILNLLCTEACWNLCGGTYLACRWWQDVRSMSCSPPVRKQRCVVFQSFSSEINHRLSHISQICSGFISGRVPLKFIKLWQFGFSVLFRFSVLFICRKWVYVVKQNFKENLLFKNCCLPLKEMANGKIFCNWSNSPRDNLPKQSWE